MAIGVWGLHFLVTYKSHLSSKLRVSGRFPSLSIPSILLVPFRPRASHIMDAGRYCLIDPPHKEIRRSEAALRNLARIAPKEVSKKEYTLMSVPCLLSRSHRQGVS